MSRETAGATEERATRLDPAEFIKANMGLSPVPSLPEIRLYTAHP
ncbi:MAG: methyltransferase, partial [Mesorhizobium sp.]